MISNERFAGIRAFVQAVEAGSFSRAAQQLGMSPSSVGKAVARLEQRLDARLFHRTTRSLSLTDEGLAFHDSCLRALRELEQAEAGLAERRSQPAGRLRITVPVLLGRDWVMPVLLQLAVQYPALAIEAQFSNRPVDFAEEGCDLAVRIGLLQDSANLAARQLGVQRLAVCAAPAYLAQHGAPATPDALEQYACIAMLRDGRLEAWKFQDQQGKPRDVAITARLRLGHLEAVRQAALAGHGLAQLPVWLVETELASGRLQMVLEPYATAGMPLYAAWPASRAMTARLRLVIDTLRSHVPPGLQADQP
ncbi:LysR family transcriptional regulator [Janthinobacterium sp.]|uniref:LysR family transcriptional regulator n=1 Tax=Janthinobacterium sp. TaxID=1871054 RepID=UPI0026173E21|nr:LysR family transcriptional regulator [Janthinobacterium sp.]